jgi:hypothetical protein
MNACEQALKMGQPEPNEQQLNVRVARILIRIVINTGVLLQYLMSQVLAHPCAATTSRLTPCWDRYAGVNFSPG